MASRKRSPELSDWREIASLGEQLAGANSLIAQRDRIVSLASRLLRGRAEVWLHEQLFRLPDWESKRVFPLEPRSQGMRRAIARHKLYVRRAERRKRGMSAVVALPIEDQGFLLGAVQVSRSRGPDFGKEEVELLESIASVVAVGLYASHRVAVERFRLGELNLVSQVSAEIANVVNLDELTRRVTELIQKAFNYYYVAIFTLKQGATQLRFRSSASAPRRGKKSVPVELEVTVGQGLIGEAAATGELVAAQDVGADARYRYVERLQETCSELAIPLKLEDRVLGVLDVQSNRVNAFHPNDLLVLRALADNVARAVEGARLYSDIRRRADQLALVAEVSRGVTSTLDLQEMMNGAAALIHDRFGYPHVSLYTVHPIRRRIEYEAGSGRRSQALRGYNIPLDEPRGIIPWVAREARTVLANDVTRESRYRPSPLPPKDTRSELTVPLVFGERVVGVLDIQSNRLNGFTEDDQLMFEAVAGTIAAAIRNADLYRSEQWRRQVADSLREVAGLLSEHVGVDAALDAILTELERNLPVDVAVIWLLDQRKLHVAAIHGANAEAVEDASRNSRVADAALRTIMASQEPVIRQASDPSWPIGLAAGLAADYSSLAAPLRLNNQAVGVIALAHHEPGRYGHEARAMAATFASYAAVAIENARLYDAAQEQAYASAAQLQIAKAISTPGDITQVLEMVLRSIPIVSGVEWAVLYGWDATRRVYIPRAQSGPDEGDERGIWYDELAEGRFALGDAARISGADRFCVVHEKNAPEGWMESQPAIRAPQTLRDSERLLIAVPLSIQNDLLGVLLVKDRYGMQRFRVRRLEIVHGIAQQVAVALQNDMLQKETVVRERLETEVHLARDIQRTFIPNSLPQYQGWEVAARWETARQVGGDLYDVLELPRGRLGFLVADVSDKGMPAALFMALTRTLFRAAAAEARGPAEALRRVNDLLIPDTRQGMFVTAVYAVLDVANGSLTYSNAGHNPPLWIRGEGEPVMLTRTGMALGVIEAAEISEATIHLGSGESVLLYTDGLTEAFAPSGEIFGQDRLLDIIRRQRPASAEDLLLVIESELSRFRDTAPLSDDLTMLAIRRQ